MSFPGADLFFLGSSLSSFNRVTEKSKLHCLCHEVDNTDGTRFYFFPSQKFYGTLNTKQSSVEEHVVELQCNA